jgi:hypothetical protein
MTTMAGQPNYTYTPLHFSYPVTVDAGLEDVNGDVNLVNDPRNEEMYTAEAQVGNFDDHHHDRAGLDRGDGPYPLGYSRETDAHYTLYSYGSEPAGPPQNDTQVSLEVK